MLSHWTHNLYPSMHQLKEQFLFLYNNIKHMVEGNKLAELRAQINILGFFLVFCVSV